MKEFSSPSKLLPALDMRGQLVQKENNDSTVLKMMSNFEQKINFLEMQHKEALEREENLRKLNNSIMFAISDIHSDGENVMSKPSALNPHKSKIDECPVSQYLLESAQKKFEIKIDELEKEIEYRKNDRKKLELEKDKVIKELRSFIERLEQEKRIYETQKMKWEEERRLMKDSFERELKNVVSEKEREASLINQTFKHEILDKEKDFANRLLMVQNLNEQEKRSYVTRLESLQAEKDVLQRSNAQNLVLYEESKSKMMEEMTCLRKQTEEHKIKSVELDRNTLELKAKVFSKELENERLKEELSKLHSEKNSIESQQQKKFKEKFLDLREKERSNLFKEDFGNTEEPEQDRNDSSIIFSSRTPNKETRFFEKRNLDLIDNVLGREDREKNSKFIIESSKSPKSRSAKYRTPISSYKGGSSTGPLYLNFEEEDLKNILRAGYNNNSACQSLNSSSKNNMLLTGECEPNSRSTPTTLSKILKEIDYKNFAYGEKGKKVVALTKQEERRTQEDTTTNNRRKISKDCKENQGRSVQLEEESERNGNESNKNFKRELNVDRSLASLLKYTPKKQTILNANNIQEEIKKKINSIHQRSLSSNNSFSNAGMKTSGQNAKKCQTGYKPKENNKKIEEGKLSPRGEISDSASGEKNGIATTLSPKYQLKNQQNPRELKFEILNLFDKVIKISDSQQGQQAKETSIIAEAITGKSISKRSTDRAVSLLNGNGHPNSVFSSVARQGSNF